MVELKNKKMGGLSGVVAGDSAICDCNPGNESLLYRGFDVKELAQNASFEETAWLLLHQKLPNIDELQGFKSDLSHLRQLSPSLKQILENVPPTAQLMDALRSAVSILGHIYPEHEEVDPFLIQERLIASLGSMLLYWYHYHASGRRCDLAANEDSLSTHILHLITNKPPTPEQARAFEISMILYAEHEFNASTFAVRIVSSTLSDYYSAICAGIGALRGPLHGGANEKALQLIQSFSSPDEAEKGILKKLEQKELVMGFGHRVYTTSDPRSSIIFDQAQLLAKTDEEKKLIGIAEKIEAVMQREKKLFPNLDFYSALVYHFLGIKPFFFTPIFAMARSTGWSAHFLEQRANNKLIRPISRYTGPEQKAWVELEKRNG